jgi:hypothetical protein
MSSVLKFINSLPTIDNNDDVTTNLNYIKRSATLINDALQKGLDVLQLASGDIEITEVKTITYKYVWDEEINKFTRAATGTKQKKRRRKTQQKTTTANDESKDLRREEELETA